MRLARLWAFVLATVITIPAFAAQPILVLQSDFGLLDGAVASMKGVAVGVSPDIHIYDLTHQIEPFNIWQGALRLVQTAEYWPAGTVFVSVVDYLVGAVLLIGMMIYYRIPVTAAILFLPVVMLVQVIFTSAVALFLAMANLFYRDVKYLFEVFVMLWMFASSVLYPLNDVASRWKFLLALNPMTPIIDAYRDVILFGRLPPMHEFAAVTAASLVALVIAWVMFHRSEYQFAEFI